MINKIKHILLYLLLILVATVTNAEIKASEILGTGKVIAQFDQPSKRYTFWSNIVSLWNSRIR